MYDLSQDANETQNLYRDPRYADVQRRLWSRMQELEAAIPERPKIEAARKNA